MADTTKTNENHSISRFYHYLDVAHLSHRFAATKLEAWALGQLRGISRSLLSLAQQTQDIDRLLQALSYARILEDKLFERQVQTLIEQSYRSILRASIQPPTSIDLVRQQSLITMFEHPNLQADYPSLFGFVFCLVLSQGSQFWLKQPSFSREDRIKFMSAHVHLTPFPGSELELDWIDDTLTEAHPRGNAPGPQTCAQCDFLPSWRAWFAPFSKKLKEQQIPETGAILLSRLATRRVGFAQDVGSLDGSCVEKCKERFIKFVDEKTDRVFALFAAFYKYVE